MSLPLPIEHHQRLLDAPADPAAFFRVLEAARIAALLAADAPMLERLHAPDYELVTPTGRRYTRARYLSQLGSGQLRYLRWDAGPIAVRCSAAMTLLRYPVTLALDDGNGSGTPFDCIHFDAYERHGEVWQALWSQATAVKP